MAVGKGVFITFAVLFLITIGGGFLYFGSIAQNVAQQPTPTEQAAASEQFGQAPSPSDPALSPYCRQNSALNLDARVLNIESKDTGKSYMNATLLQLDKTTGTLTTNVINTAGGTNSDSFQRFSSVLTCGHEYDICVRTTGLNASGGGADNAPVCKNYKPNDVTGTLNIIFDAETYMNDAVQIRIFDYDANAYVWRNGTTAANTYTVLGTGTGTTMNWTNTSSGANEAGRTIASGDTYKFRMDAKTATTDKVCGIRTWKAWDYADGSDASDWQAPSVTTLGGVDLPEIKGSLSANDQLALNIYERVYDFGKPVKDQDTSTIETFTTGAGINADYDLRFRYVCTGIYQDEATTNGIIGRSETYGVGFRADGTTRTEMVSPASMIGRLVIDEPDVGSIGS